MRLVNVTCILLAWLAATCPAAVRTGLDNIGAHQNLFRGQRLGIVANHTSYNSAGKYIVDVFRAMQGVRVVALFSPEHGLRGLEEAGEKVDNETDPVTGLPVYSLYGKINKPTPQMLADVDVLVFDIQDVGARFYTYLYTMSLAMEAAAENGKRFVVLDRPNPINGVQLEGPVLELKFATFVGLYPIPVRYGLTVGELARMINGEGWLANGVKADLTVVPLTGWRRGMWFDQTGLRFLKPSPNMPDLETATIYPGLCLIEGTNLSEGRGTPKPFRQFGAPWIDSNALAAKLNALNLPGLRFQPASFTPTSSKFQNQKCHGVEILLTDRTRLESFWTGVQIVNELYRLYPDQFKWSERHFDRLCGTATIREAIIAQKPLQLLKATWSAECKTFDRARRKYLLYDDKTADTPKPSILEIERFAVTGKDLRLDYRLNNAFPHDIWVCEDIDSVGRYAGQTAETRITDDTLRIRLLGNLEHNVMFGGGNYIWARYRRVAPRQLHSERILLALPVGNRSTVYRVERPHSRKKHVALHHLTLEVGFFTEDLPTLFSQSMQNGWLFPDLSYSPPESKDPNIAFVPYPWKGMRREKLAQVNIADINVPAEIAANVRDTFPYRQQ